MFLFACCRYHIRLDSGEEGDRDKLMMVPPLSQECGQMIKYFQGISAGGISFV